MTTPVDALPRRPEALTDRPVAAWSAPVRWPTYLPEPADRYPAYLERRVYQGSSGAVYPMPVHDRVARRPEDRDWPALHLENEYLRIVVLPGLGGRLQLAIDRRTGYSLFHDPGVIKPALVGLAGPWLAGGIELNWPQHHRPATFLPCAWELEESEEHATVWLSDHDPLARLKGLHGFRLSAGSTVLELRVRLYNRTDEPQTFLWWANAAVTAHADYQSCFPPDVHWVADHAKRAVTTFPVPTSSYYGIDYPARRGSDSHPDSARRVPGDRLDWVRNIPVPTSFMCLGSRQDFFGGYDHRADAGVVHWADHHYAVGKKQWTWGEADFGRMWNRNLTDDGSRYLELMAGVFTDNQPDFAFLAPGETKQFAQCWYPLSGTGPVVAATRDVALCRRADLQELAGTSAGGEEPAASEGRSARTQEAPAAAPAEGDAGDGAGRWTLCATRTLPGTVISVTGPSGSHTEVVDLSPDRIWRYSGSVNEVRVEHDGTELLSWCAQATDSSDEPVQPAREPLPPAEVHSVDELFRIGAHLAQYRHATRSPEPYWLEAVRRDPGHPGARTALAWRRYREARYEEAESHLRAALSRLTALNPNPPEGEAHYLLGLTLARQGRDDEAYAAFAKATWLRAWVGPGSFQMAALDARAGRTRAALQRVEAALAAEPDHLQAAALRVVLLRRLGERSRASAELAGLTGRDPLHVWSRDLAGTVDSVRGLAEAQTLLDVGLEYERVGEWAEALRLFADSAAQDEHRPPGQTACAPLADYHAACVWDRIGNPDAARRHRDRARTASRTWVFPGRLEDVAALEAALAADPRDPTASALLGHWLYAHRRPLDAIDAWRRSASEDASDPVVWRNLGVAAYNQERDASKALACYEQALTLAPGDGRLWYESDQLLARMRWSPPHRLDRLSQAPAAALAARDDLLVVRAHLLASAGRTREAHELLASHQFQPWEGGEGEVLRAWDRVCWVLAEQALLARDAAAAAEFAQAALRPPANLGEARHPLASASHLWLCLGDASAAASDQAGAVRAWEQATDTAPDLITTVEEPRAALSFYAILAAQRRGDDRRAAELRSHLEAYAEHVAATPARIDYFATSLPSLLLFHDDPQDERDVLVTLLHAQLAWLDGRSRDAEEHVSRVLRERPDHELALDLSGRLNGTGSGR